MGLGAVLPRQHKIDLEIRKDNTLKEHFVRTVRHNRNVQKFHDEFEHKSLKKLTKGGRFDVCVTEHH